MSDQQQPSQCLFLCQRSPWIWLQLELAFLFHVSSSGNCCPPLPSPDSGGLLPPLGLCCPSLSVTLWDGAVVPVEHALYLGSSGFLWNGF